MAWAELRKPVGRSAEDASWIEVVADEKRPVQGTRLRPVRLALRWADAAVRAESRPAGLDPEVADDQWDELAALAWEGCQTSWAAAGDASRACLATARLAKRSVRRQRPFLAEAEARSRVGSMTAIRRLAAGDPAATKSAAPWPTTNKAAGLRLPRG